MKPKSFSLISDGLRRLSLRFLLIFIGTLLLSGCTRLSLSSDADASFEAFTAQLFQNEVAASTISLHYTLKTPSSYGIDDFPVTYGSFSSNETVAKASIENCIAALHRYDPEGLSAENHLTYDILDSYLKDASDGAKYLLYQEPLSPVTGIHSQLPVLLSEYQFYDVEDAKIYLRLLEETDTYFESLIAFEQKKSKAGLFMPDYQVDAVTNQCCSFVDMAEENYLYSTFEERLESLPDLSTSEKEELISQNKQIIENSIFPAYTYLAGELDSLRGSGQNEQGLCYLPDGKSYYEYLVEQSTGIHASISELQSRTLQQITADLAAMEKVLFPTAVPSDTASVLEQTEPSSMLNDLRQKIDEAFPTIPSVGLSIKYVPDAMEEYLSPAFYMIPAIDNISENVIYINRGQTAAGLNLYTTLAHEGYPGHLYQTVYFASTKPDPVRNILDFGGYVEGWATYAEMMSYYLAPLSKNEALLLQKNSSVLLGLYSLADMGIHYDGWSLTDTVSFFKDYGITDINAVKSIYELIVGTPGNYLKYYLGYLEFYDFKKEMSQMLGEDFSQKAFHQAVLDVGPAPFDIVKEYAKKALLTQN